MEEGYGLLYWVVELIYINKIKESKWWQFGKRRKANQWRQKQISHRCKKKQ